MMLLGSLAATGGDAHGHRRRLREEFKNSDEKIWRENRPQPAARNYW